MNKNKHGYRSLRDLIPLVIIVAVLLSGCVDQSASSSSGSTSSSISSSSSQEPEPNSDSVASLPIVSSSSDSEETSTPSYDMDSWDWQEHSYEGYTISLPSSCSIGTGDKIDVNEAQIPQSLFKINSYPSVIGWLIKDVGPEFLSLEKINDTTYNVTPSSDSEKHKVVSILSDDPTLPDATFYEFKDYLAFTNISSIGGDGSRDFFSKDTVYIPQNGKGLVVVFFGEEDSTECKPFYERIIESIRTENK